MAMLEKTFANADLEIELTSYIDNNVEYLIQGKRYC